MKGINKKITAKSKTTFDILVICLNRLNSIEVYHSRKHIGISIRFGDGDNKFSFFITKIKINISEKDLSKHLKEIQAKIRSFLYDEVLKFNSNKEEILNLNELDYFSVLDSEHIKLLENKYE